jgi:hypothetical protein
MNYKYQMCQGTCGSQVVNLSKDNGSYKKGVKITLPLIEEGKSWVMEVILNERLNVTRSDIQQTLKGEIAFCDGVKVYIETTNANLMYGYIYKDN